MFTFVAGFLLDLLLGDPYWMPHPIRLMGSAIGKLDKLLLGVKCKEQQGKCEEQQGKCEEHQRRRQQREGILLVVVILWGTFLAAMLVLEGAYVIWPPLGILVESWMTYQILACKCLKVESMKVYEALETKSLAEARQAVSMIVGRDTESLDEIGVAKAAVETVAENTSDGVIAPMLYTALGGPVLGFLYKAINTMDSMVGYKNERYLHFGRAAAKLDDVVNFLPARISAVLMIVSCFFLGKDFNGKKAVEIFKRDRFCHASPNSAQTEAVCAGALGVRLAGDASYFGKVVKKPYIGDESRAVEPKDIRRSNRLLYGAAILCEALCLAGMYFIFMI